jgi:hypothetical protein
MQNFRNFKEVAGQCHNPVGCQVQFSRGRLELLAQKPRCFIQVTRLQGPDRGGVTHFPRQPIPAYKKTDIRGSADNRAIQFKTKQNKRTQTQNKYAYFLDRKDRAATSTNSNGPHDNSTTTMRKYIHNLQKSSNTSHLSSIRVSTSQWTCSKILCFLDAL